MRKRSKDTYTLTIDTRMKTFVFKKVLGWSSLRTKDGDCTITVNTVRGEESISFNDDNLLWIRKSR